MITHEFTVLGRTFRLTKHPRDQKLPAEQQASRPWYFRPGGRAGTARVPKKVGEHNQIDAAVAAATRLVLASEIGGHPYEKARADLAYRQGLRVGAIVDQWIAAGYPLDTGQARGAAQQADQATRLVASRKFWDSKAVAAVDGPMLRAFNRWRHSHSREGFGGDTATDRELVTYSNAFAWAVAEGHATSNPFATRPRFRAAKDVEHCHRRMPVHDEEFHRLTGALLAVPETIVHGAVLCLCGLAGLRPTEPSRLRWDARHVGTQREPGNRWRSTPDGVERLNLAVYRQKAGCNPAVTIHPALAAFIAAWEAYAHGRWPGSPWWFPDPRDASRPFMDPAGGDTRLIGPLKRVVARLNLSPRSPHGFRGYYVRVRRSQGAPDLQIAVELGHNSGQMVSRTYGNRGDVADSGLYDWLPDPASGVPLAWSLLGDTAGANILHLPAVSPAPAPAGLDTNLDTTNQVSKGLPTATNDSRAVDEIRQIANE